MIKRLSGTLSGGTPRINIRMPSARSGTTAAAGTGSDQVSRLDKLKQGIINNKKKNSSRYFSIWFFSSSISTTNRINR